MYADLRAYIHELLLGAVVSIRGTRGLFMLQLPGETVPQVIAEWPQSTTITQEDLDIARQALVAQQVHLSPFSNTVVRLAIPLAAGNLRGAFVLYVPQSEYDVRLEHFFYLLAQQTAQTLYARFFDDNAHSYTLIYKAGRVLETLNEPEFQAQHVADTLVELGSVGARVTLAMGISTEDVFVASSGNAAELPVLNNLVWDADRRPDDGFYLREHPPWQSIAVPVYTSENHVSAVVELVRPVVELRPKVAEIRPELLFIAQFGSNLERGVLLRSLRRTADLLVEQVDELEFSRRVDREISSRLDPDRIIKLSLEWALRRTKAETGCVVVIDSVLLDYYVKESVGYPTPTPSKRMNDQLGIIGRCLREKRTQIVPDVRLDSDYVEVIPATVTQLVLPLISNQRVLGAISLESKHAGRFDSGAILFMERMVSIAAIALDNAQLLQQAEQLADDMSLIYNVGRMISSSLEWDASVSAIAHGIGSAVRGTVIVFSYDSQAEKLKTLSIYRTEFPATLPAPGTVYTLDEYPDLQEAIQQKHLMLSRLENTQTTWLRNLGTGAVAFAPLVAQGNVVGLAIVIKHGDDVEFAHSEVFVTESLADQSASVLRQASLYAEVRELENLKSEMIRMASHDLRGPIANIIGYTELLDSDLTGLKTAEMQFFVDSIRNSVNLMEMMVSDLLTLEQIDSQREESWEPIALDEVVAEVITEHQATAHLKTQTLISEINNVNLNVLGSKFQLRQAVSNLVGNGLKYTPEGGQVHVKLYREPSLPRLIFQVVDNGYGISLARQERLFQRFYRAKQPGTEHISGTGLGLSMVKTVIEKHGGRISFESKEGAGTTFTFWLPLA